jgi:uncharacterized membrane protein
MDPAAQLWFATAAFIATHFVTSTPLRAALARALGNRGYVVAYSLVAFATLGWMIWAYAKAPAEPLWAGWRMLPALVMPVAFVLFACGAFARNPTLVGADRLLKSAEPARGIIRVTRHPIMWAFLIWAAAHVLARGEMKSLVFFGGLFAVAGLGTLLMDQRKAKALGEDWKRFAAVTSHVPFVAIAQGRNRFNAAEIGWRNPLIGLALYGIFFWAHPMFFGARPY